jgi:hypothetical protein
VTKQRCCDNKLVLGLHAVESQTGKLSRQVLEKQNLCFSGRIPLLAKFSDPAHDLPPLR